MTKIFFFPSQHSLILQVIKDKFQASASLTMDDEYSYYGKDASLQFALNGNRNQIHNILVHLNERLYS